MSDTRQKRYQKVAEIRSAGQPDQTLLSEAKLFDPRATTSDLIADLRRVQELFPGRFITRTIYRKEGRYSDSTWDSRFGTMAEFRKQAGLELSRGQQTLERQIAKHASADVYRGFYEVEVLPFVGRYEHPMTPGTKRVLVVSDLHDLELDPFAYAVALDVARRTQPDIVVFNGDVHDQYAFSRFDKDPREIKLVERFVFVRDMIFKPMREACPNAQIDLVLGNHEHRLLRHLAEKTPYLKVVLSDLMGLTLAQLLGLPEFKINLVSKWDLSAWNPRDVNGEVARNYAIYYDCFVVAHEKDPKLGLSGTSGHTHHPHFDTWTDHSGDKWWVTTGALCNREASYTPLKTSAQQSFLLVTINPETRECIPEHIYIQRNSAVYAEKLYTRGQEAK